MTESPGILWPAATAAASSVLYWYVARRCQRGDLEAEYRLPNAAFTLWWYALSLTSGLSALNSVYFGYFDSNDLALYSVSVTFALGALSVGLWGLLYHLLYLFTGWRQVSRALGVFYGLVFGLLAYLVQSRHVIGLDVEAYRLTPVFEHPSTPALEAVVVALFILPPVFGAMAYGSLLFRVQDRSQRFRVGVVSGSIFVWFLSSYVVNVAGDSAAMWWRIISLFVGPTAALLALMAYHPPAWLRRHYHLMSIDERPSAGGI